MLAHRRVATALITASPPEGSAQRCEKVRHFFKAATAARRLPPKVSSWGKLSGRAKSGKICARSRGRQPLPGPTGAFVTASPLPPSLIEMNGGGVLPGAGVKAAKGLGLMEMLYVYIVSALYGVR